MPSKQAELMIPTVFREGVVHHRRTTMHTDKQKPQTSIPQNGDKRLGIERRRFSYDAHIPERRSGQDRRSAGVRLEITSESYSQIVLGLG